MFRLKNFLQHIRICCADDTMVMRLWPFISPMIVLTCRNIRIMVVDRIEISCRKYKWWFDGFSLNWNVICTWLFRLYVVALSDLDAGLTYMNGVSPSPPFFIHTVPDYSHPFKMNIIALSSEVIAIVGVTHTLKWHKAFWVSSKRFNPLFSMTLYIMVATHLKKCHRTLQLLFRSTKWCL